MCHVEVIMCRSFENVLIYIYIYSVAECVTASFNCSVTHKLYVRLCVVGLELCHV